MYRQIFHKYIDNNTKKIGDDIFINCPFHKDKNASCSVSTNADKPVYHCFSCGKKGSWIGFYMEENHCSFNEALDSLKINNYQPVQNCNKIKKAAKRFYDLSHEVLEYQQNFENDYIKNGKDLYNKIGLTLSTALSCFIGKKDDNWIFPVFKYPDGEVVGYEVRHSNFTNFTKGNKCYKSKLPDGYSLDCLSMTFAGNMEKRVIICEGFKDSYFVYQYLCEKEGKGNIDDTILTPTCGVKTIVDLLKENSLDQFDRILFILDNDKAGNEINKIIEKYDDRYSFFKKLQDGEDFEQYYKRIRKQLN